MRALPFNHPVLLSARNQEPVVIALQEAVLAAVLKAAVGHHDVSIEELGAARSMARDRWLLAQRDGQWWGEPRVVSLAERLSIVVRQGQRGLVEQLAEADLRKLPTAEH